MIIIFVIYFQYSTLPQTYKLTSIVHLCDKYNMLFTHLCVMVVFTCWH